MFRFLSFVLFFVLPMLAGSTALAASPASGLTWRGDLATSRALMSSLATAWHKSGHPALDLQPFSTISGLDAVLAGKVDMAGSARGPFAGREGESDLTFTPLAWDAVVLIVQSGNPVRHVSLAQLHDIYYGKITNWKALGGPDHRIHLYSVASPLDGIEFDLRKYLFRRGNQPVASRRLYINTEQLEAAVALDPWGLGASTLSGVHANNKVATLTVNGVAPTLANVEDGSYPLYRPLYLVTTGSDPEQAEIEAFLGFARSDAGRAVIHAQHLLPWQPDTRLATGLAEHEQRVQQRSAPELRKPVAAPGATYAARSAQAPMSERTGDAQQRLAIKRQREAASKKAREANRERLQATHSS